MYLFHKIFSTFCIKKTKGDNEKRNKKTDSLPKPLKPEPKTFNSFQLA